MSPTHLQSKGQKSLMSTSMDSGKMNQFNPLGGNIPITENYEYLFLARSGALQSDFEGMYIIFFCEYFKLITKNLRA